MRSPLAVPSTAEEKGYRSSLRARQERQERDLGFLAELEPLQLPTFEEYRRFWVDVHEDARRADRSRRALGWREARARLRSLPPEVRVSAIVAWNSHGCPAEPEYLLSFLAEFAPSEEELAMREALRLQRIAALRRNLPRWIEHVPCGGVLEEWLGLPGRWSCLECNRTFVADQAVAAARAGELRLVDNRAAVQESLL